MSYGDWAQWKRRDKAALREGTGIFGVHCPHTAEADVVCDDCWVLVDEWVGRHGVSPSDSDEVVNALEAARRMSGLA